MAYNSNQYDEKKIGKEENDDDEYSGSTPPPWLDEFEYIDWCITH